MPIKTFTPDSARRALEAVRPAALTMTRTYLALERLRPMSIDSDQALPPGYYHGLRHLIGALDVLRLAGALVRDPAEGLVDFPAVRSGRLVYLCWKVGETGIEFWHEVDGGIDERRPVRDDGQWEDAASGRP